jgi:hypothetical protein
VPYQNENAAYFALATFAWPILFFIAAKCTTDTNYFKEEGVGIPIHVQLEMKHHFHDGVVIEAEEGKERDVEVTAIDGVGDEKA